MRKFLYVVLLISSSLACGIAVPQGKSDVFTDTHSLPEVSTEVNSVVMVVVADEGLNIRADHSEESEDIGDLFPGDIVTCELPFMVIGDSVWCKHERGWSNARWLEAK